MRVRATLWLVLATGCGRLGFDASSGVGSDAQTDAAIDAPPCTPGPWGMLRPQLALRSGDDDWEATLSPDGLVLVFGRQIIGNADLFVATRATPAADFGSAVGVAAASSPGTFESSPMWSPDGRQLTFSYDNRVATTEARVLGHLGNGSFSSTFTLADMPADSGAWEITPDGRELFYTTVKGTFDYDLGHATRETLASPWVEDADVAGLVRDGMSEGWPAYDAARGILYYERDEGSDAVITEAKRPAPGTPFELLGPAGFLAGQDGDPDISADGLTLVFSSQRLGGTNNDIFLTSRSCL